MRRLVAVLSVATLLLAACGRADDEPAATPPAPADVTVLTSPTADTTTTLASKLPTAAPRTTTTSTASPPDPGLAWPSRPILVANSDGVFQIATDRTVTRVVDGRVAFAIDDTRGGLLYQLDRGRDWGDFFGDPTPGFDTSVYWIPGGESIPRDLLVPTPGAGHSLTLEDAFATGDSFAVVYIRHEGEAPPFDGNMADTLRVYDVASQAVTELGRVRGWEWNFGAATAGAGLVATSEYPIFGGGCRLYEASGLPASLPGYPQLTDACYGETANCPTGCAIAPDAASYVSVTWSQEREEWSLEVVAVDGTTRHVVATHVLPALAGPIGALDVAGGFLLLNRHGHEGAPFEALILPPTSPHDPLEVPLAGEARFVTAPVRLPPATVAAGGPAYYRYGEDGVFRVVNGVATRLLAEPVAHVWDDHAGGIIVADVTTADIRHLRNGDVTPVPLDRRSGYASARFTGLLDGQPTLFFAGMPEDADLDQWPCADWALNSRNLATGAERRHVCLPIDDAWYRIQSFGRGWLVGAFEMAVGTGGTAVDLRFWNLDGEQLTVEHNPFPESCAPCDLAAFISPDGALLAYLHRPDAKWPPEDWESASSEEWWEQSKDIPARVVVQRLDNGTDVWETQVSAGSDLVDFDGRYLVVRSGWDEEAPHVIYDITGEHGPLQVAGAVALMREPVAIDGPGG